MRPFLLFAIVGALTFMPKSAEADQTLCSEPSRAGILAQTSVRIPRNDEPAFAEAMRQFTEVSTMSQGEGFFRDGQEWARTLYFQSPEVSVAIDVDTWRGSDIAKVTAYRTCINDELEDWKPYWSDFREYLHRVTDE